MREIAMLTIWCVVFFAAVKLFKADDVAQFVGETAGKIVAAYKREAGK